MTSSRRNSCSSTVAPRVHFVRCYNNGLEERTIKKLGELKQSYKSQSTNGGSNEAAAQLGPTVVTNCALGFEGHQRWCGEGDSRSAGKARMWCEKGSMRLLQGLIWKPSLHRVTHVPHSVWLFRSFFREDVRKPLRVRGRRVGMVFYSTLNTRGRKHLAKDYTGLSFRRF